jgi:hypothetical protein
MKASVSRSDPSTAITGMPRLEGAVDFVARDVTAVDE